MGKSQHKRLDVTNQCQRCGKSFHPWHKDSAFCSKKCQILFLSDASRERIDVTCPTCGKTFEIIAARAEKSERNFCSVECRAKFFASHSLGHKTCAQCGKSFSIPMSFPNKKYCSAQCRSRAAKHRVIVRVHELVRQVNEFGVLWEGHGMDANYDPFGGVAI